MNVVIVNNDPIQVEKMKEQFLSAYSDIYVTEFTDAMSSVNYICGHMVDVVIVEAQMRRVNGLQLMKVIRTQKPDQMIVILANDNRMQEEAENQTVDGYYIKPITEVEIKEIYQLAQNQEVFGITKITTC